METLNFIDISSWQRGLDLKNLFGANPDLAGVIVKASGGIGNKQPMCDPWVQTLINLRKPWGFYHFLNDDGKGSSPEAEAKFFISQCRNYFGKGAPAADYEGLGLRFGTDYLKKFLDTVYEITGIKPFVYCSQSLIQERDFSEIAAAGYPLWLAQYGSMSLTGFKEHPWQKGSVEPFNKIWMHQYSSTGRLKGWNGNLDLDLFYGDISDWNDIVKGKLSAIDIPSNSEISTENTTINPQLIQDILDGKYGNGLTRITKLKAAGYNYDTIQGKINELYEKASEINKILDSSGEYKDLLKRIVNI